MVQLKKVCSVCKKTRRYSSFYNSSATKTGKGSKCKDCTNRLYKRWRQTKGIEITRRNNRRYYAQNKDTVEYKYLRLKNGAKQRDKVLELTFHEFKEMWAQDCYYCGEVVMSAGLDRVDSSKGYIKGNIVRCCEKCNRAKNNMSVDEFIAHCRKVIHKHDIDSSSKCNSTGFTQV